MASQCCSWVTTSQNLKTRSLQEQGYVCGQHAHDAGHGKLQTNKHTSGAKGVCGKRRPRNAGRIRGRNVSVSCGHLDVFQETPFRLALCCKVSGNGEFLADQGSHETFETSFALHSRHARHASGVGSAPRTVDGIAWLVSWIVGRPRRKTEVDSWWSADAWWSVRGWLVSNTETNSSEQW